MASQSASGNAAADNIRDFVRYLKNRHGPNTCLNQSCWLFGEAADWNSILHVFGYELVEKRPSLLCLRTIPHARVSLTNVSARVAAFIISALVTRHACVQEVDVSYVPMPLEGPFEPLPIRVNGSVRHVRARNGRRFYYGPCHEVDLCNAQCLETLVFDGVGMSPSTVSGIAATLRRNAATLKELTIVNTEMLQRDSNKLWRALRKCARLKTAALAYHVNSPGSVKIMLEVLKSSTTIQTLMVPELGKSCHVAQLAEVLATNKSLLDLHLNAPALSLVSLFKAFEVNSTVERLHISFTTISEREGAALGSMLSRNRGLKTLLFEGSTLTPPGAELLTEALKKNVTLECLEFQSTQVDTASLCCLCEALDQNKTLREVKFGHFSATKKERAKLAAVLARTKSYGRFRLPLSDTDVPGLVPVLSLTSPASPRELELRNICDMAVDLLGELCEALASNTTVRTLKAGYGGHSPCRGDLLSEMLEVNKSITSVQLILDSASLNYCLAAKVAAALVHNTTVEELSLHMGNELLRPTARSFQRLLSWNETLTKVVFTSIVTYPAKRIALIVSALTKNKVILEFGSNKPPMRCNANSLPVFEALRQNQNRLSSAVEFVQRKPRDRRRAEAFEFLCEKRHLRSSVALAMGRTESEALQDIASSLYYLWDNYFVITGVVRHSVRCYPHQGTTQIDALNADCWRALVRYLKVSDVRAE